MRRCGLRFLGEQESVNIMEMDDKKARWSGYALKWDDVANIRDFFFSYHEQFVRGAFKKTIEERGPQGNGAIKLLRQHDTRRSIAGRYTDLYEDDVGLRYEAETIETSVGMDLAVELREGTLHNMSINFDSIAEDYDKNNNRFIVKEARLYEISPVLFGAYEESTVENVRSFDSMAADLDRMMGALKRGRELLPHEIGQLTKMRAKLTEILNTDDSEPDETPLGSQAPQEEGLLHANDLDVRLSIAERALDLM